MNINHKGTLNHDISEVAIVDGIQAWYPLNGDTNDRSGNLNHGTVSGATIVNGLEGLAYSFDGVDDYAIINNDFTSNIANGFTMSAWFKKTGEGSNYECVLHKGADATVGGSEFWLGIEANNHLTATIGARTGVGWAAGQTTTLVVLNTWYHLAATWDGTTVRVYINGQEAKQYALSSYGHVSMPTRIGASSDGANYQYCGVVGDTRIYNRALSPEEVGILYSLTGGSNDKMKVTKDKIYLKGQIKEV